MNLATHDTSHRRSSRTRSAAALILALLLLSGSFSSSRALAYDPWESHLPENRVLVVVDGFGSGDLEQVLREGLNSPWDTMALELHGDLQVVLGGKARVGADILYTEDGQYQVGVLREVAVTAGFKVKALGQLGVQGALGETVVDHYTFPTLSDTAKGLEYLVICHTLGPLILDAIEASESALADLIGELGDSRAQLRSWEEELATQSGRLATLKSRLSDVQSGINSLQSAISAGCSSIIKHPNCDEWASELSRLKSVRTSINNGINAANSAISAAQNGIDSLRSVLRSIENAIAEAESGLEDLRGLLAYIVEARRFVDEHRSGFQVELFLSFGASGGISPFTGVTIENAEGIKLGVDNDNRAILRHYEGSGSHPERMWLRFHSNIKGYFAARFVLGTRADALLSLEHHYHWDWNGQSWQQNPERPHGIRIRTDISLVDSVGFLVAGQLGMGRQTRIDFAYGDIASGAEAFWAALVAGDFGGMVDAVGSAPGTFWLRDRWITGLVAGGGFQAVANGSLGASAMWTDEGTASVDVLPLSEGLRRTFEPFLIQRTGSYVVASTDAEHAALAGRLSDGSAEPQPVFRRGDVTGDGIIEITDPILLLGHLFLGEGEIVCLEAADTNDDGQMDLTDSIYLLQFQFLGDSEPPAPGPSLCGVDPEGSPDLGCESYDACFVPVP